MIRKLIFILFVFFINISYGYSISKNPAYVVIDYNNGIILDEKNANSKMYPASLTKLMTLFIIFDKLEDNEISFNQELKISSNAAKQVPSKLGLPEGSKITIKDAILSIIVRSNNDIAYALAENIAGSEKEFVILMNKKVKELGLKNTNFENSSGLHNDKQYTTAKDMATLARALMIHHNKFYPLFTVEEFKWDQRTYTNTNRLLKYDYIDGMKTGYTSKSGYNLITSGYNHNIRVISVVMGYRTSEKRNLVTKTILDQALLSSINKRKNILQYKTQPIIVQANNILILNNKETSNIYNISLDNEHYNIKKISYIDKIYNADFTPSINPSIKKVVAKKPIATTSRRGRYAVQVGAFSTYKKALNVSYNISNIKDVSKTLTKKKITVKKASNLYIARFNNLSYDSANNTCKILKSKRQDCFVVKS